VDIVYLDFSKPSDTVSHKILIDKLMKYRVDKQTVKLTENWLNGQARRVVFKDTKPSWGPVISSIPQGLIVGPGLFKDLDDEKQCGCIKKQNKANKPNKKTPPPPQKKSPPNPPKNKNKKTQNPTPSQKA